MTRTGITFKEVAKTAAQLQGEQKSITIDNIREILGTGSKSTIAKYLREWKEKHDIQQPAEGSIPTELLTLVKGLWQHVQEKADQKISEQQQATDKQIDSFQQRLQETKQQQFQLDQQLQQEKTIHQQQIQKNAELQNVLIDEQKAHLKQQERATLFEQQLTQQVVETDRLHQHLKHVQANLEHYQAVTQALREEQSLAIEKQRHHYEQQTKELQQQLAIVLQQNAQLQFQRDQDQEIISRLEADLHHGKEKLQTLQTEHQKQTSALQTLQSQAQSLQQHIQQQTQTIGEKNQQLMNAEINLRLASQQNEQRDQEIYQLKKQHLLLQETHQTLLQEKAVILGRFQQLQIATEA